LDVLNQLAVMQSVSKTVSSKTVRSEEGGR